MRLISLQVEGFKRIKAARLVPTGPVTRIVGKNEAGKSSLLDALTVTLCGTRYNPTMPIRRGAEGAFCIADLGDIIVERRWKGDRDYIEVRTKEGAKFPSPQKMLDQYFDRIAFDPLAFDRMKEAEQIAIIAKIASIDLATFTASRKRLADERAMQKRLAEGIGAKLQAIPKNDDLPAEEMSVNTLLKKIADAEMLNRTADEADKDVVNNERHLQAAMDEVNELTARHRKLIEQVELAKNQLDAATAKVNDHEKDLIANKKYAGSLQRADLTPLRTQIAEAEEINAAIRQQKARATIVAEGNAHLDKVDELTKKIEAIEADKVKAVAAANLPVPGLSLGDDGVLIGGIPFSQCSAAQRLRTSTAIGLAMNPQLKLMIIHDGSLLDNESMAMLEEIAVASDAQILIERVDNGSDEGTCIRIVDGETVEPVVTADKTQTA